MWKVKVGNIAVGAWQPQIRYWVVLGVLQCLVLGVTLPGYTASRLDDVLARGYLNVGTTGDYPPFSWYNPDTGEYEGIDIEMARSMGEALGVKVRFVQTTWPALMTDLNNNRFDLAMGGITLTLERQKQAFFSIPYLKDGKVPLTQCHQQTRFQSLAQIDTPNVRVVENKGGTNEAFARQHLKHARLAVVDDNGSPFQQLLTGQADVMITDLTEARLQSRRHPQLCAIQPENPLTVDYKAYLLPRGDVVFQQWVNLWLTQKLENHEVEQLYSRYLGP